jgi:hypothetical protein
VDSDLELVFDTLGTMVSGSHLLLDSMTERVFLLTRRVTLAHFRASNAVLNGIVVVAGSVLIPV